MPTPRKPRKSASKAGALSAEGEQNVGEAIRRLRDAQRLSVRTLASKCGFSASFISQVELSQVSPSLASLERIASALGVTLGQFFQNSAPPVPTLTRASQRPVLRSEWSRAQIESVGHAGFGSKLEALFITLQAGGSSGARLHANETDLFAVVFAGEVQLQLQDVTHLLRRGDTIMIPPATLHRWQNNSGKPAQLLKVVARLVP
jgi:transcriptional regulator with XRE-family HTH domain